MYAIAMKRHSFSKWTLATLIIYEDMLDACNALDYIKAWKAHSQMIVISFGNGAITLDEAFALHKHLGKVDQYSERPDDGTA